VNGSTHYDLTQQNSTSSGYNSPTTSTNSASSLANAHAQADADLFYASLTAATGKSETGNISANTTTQTARDNNNLHSLHNSILEDPFDAEWAAIATRNYSSAASTSSDGNTGHHITNTNPFVPDSNAQKSFELQL